MMVEVLGSLFHLTGAAAYRDLAESQIAAFAGEAVRNPISLAGFLSGADFYFNAVQITITFGTGLEQMLRAVHGRCVPNRVLSIVSSPRELPAGHPAEGKTGIGGRATAYICVDQTCSAPITESDELYRALSGPIRAPRPAFAL
jgi:uncharacterized protein YyaL (SSP411 family)